MPSAAICIDGVEPADCTALELQWDEGTTCDEVAVAEEFEWDGACQVSDLPEVGDICALIDAGGAELAQLFCEGVEAASSTWLGEGSTCNTVPALPMAGGGALILLLLGGGLVALKLH